MTTYFVIKRETCPVCAGQGIVNSPEWTEANAFFQDLEQRTRNGLLSRPRMWQIWDSKVRDRGWENILEEEPCVECEGKGVVETQVDLAEALAALGVPVQVAEEAREVKCSF
jgi:DnaJ-class molecular chaperone